MKSITKQHCEYLRQRAKNKFDRVRGNWCDLLRWAAPERSSWITSQTPGERKNQHIVDPTHIFALRKCNAGFSEGNTSTTRPWSRIGTRDSDKNDNDENKKWLQHFTMRTMSYISSSNFYNAAGIFYNDYHVVNTGAHYFEERQNLPPFVHTLTPGSYFVIDDSYGVANILIRELSLNVKAVVDTYGNKGKDGKPDWSNISSGLKKMYNDSNYFEMIDICHIVIQNPEWDVRNPDGPMNRQWLELTYELGSAGRGSGSFENGNAFELLATDKDKDIWLRKTTTRRKPFVVGKSTETFEYGEKGPTLDALGLIKSLNKKAISKDEAIEKMLSPALQGPASLKKSYITSAANAFVPLDTKSLGKQKLESIYEINPAIGVLLQDVGDMRSLVNEAYYSDYLTYLSSNPKTRTATEANAIVDEQQRVLGPTLQSLNTTYNIPVLEWFMDYVLFEDPYLEPPPEDLAGQSLKPELVSIFAQAQKAADLPAIDRYVAMVGNVGQINPAIFDKIDLDKLADLYEDRLYLPSGLNRPQGKVEAMREQAAQKQQRQQMLQETLPAVAGAAKDLSAV